MGNIRLYGSTSGYTELAPPAVAPDGVLSLPTGTGTLATQASVGLVKIVDQSFTAVSSVSVNNCFTSAYENYRITIVGTGSADQGMNLRYRASGADDSGANYRRQALGADSTTVYGDRATGTTFALVGNFTPDRGSLAMDVFSPNLAVNTTHFSHITARGGGALINMQILNGALSTSTQYDGFTIYPASGTITGTLRVYGYQN